MIFRILRQKGFEDGELYINSAVLLIDYASKVERLYREINSGGNIENKLDAINYEEIQTICQTIKRLEKEYHKERPKILKDRIKELEKFHKEICEIVAYSEQKAETSA